MTSAVFKKSAEDPFVSLEQSFDANNLIWISKTRGSLEQVPPFQFTEDENGVIRVQRVLSRFQASRGIIQVGFQLLQLQGKGVGEYPGGLEDIQKVIQESFSLEMVLLKSSFDDSSLVPVEPSEPCNDEHIPNIESDKAAETCNKENRKSTNVIKNNKNRRKRRSTIHEPGDGWVKVRPMPEEDPFASLGAKYKHDDIAWVSNNRYSTQQPVPLQLVQHDNGFIRIHEIHPAFQEATGVQVGQRVVQLQGKDIAGYQDFQEIQNIVRDSLHINLIVIRRSASEKLAAKKETGSKSTDIAATPCNKATTDQESICSATSVADSTESQQEPSQLLFEPSLDVEESLPSKPDSTSSIEITESDETSSLFAEDDPSPAEEVSLPAEEPFLPEQDPVPSRPKRGWFKSQFFRNKRATAA